MSPVTSTFLAKVTEGRPSSSATWTGVVPGVAVRRLGGGQDQVGLGPLDGGGQHLGGAEGVGAGQGRRR